MKKQSLVTLAGLGMVAASVVLVVHQSFAQPPGSPATGTFAPLAQPGEYPPSSDYNSGYQFPTFPGAEGAYNPHQPSKQDPRLAILKKLECYSRTQAAVLVKSLETESTP